MSADLFLWPLDDGERPTVAEIQTALSRLDGYEVTCDSPSVGESWHIEIHANGDESQNAYLAIQFQNNETDCNICFENGDETTIAYVSSVVATICGPMALYHPSSPEPVLALYPNMTYHDVREALQNAT